jgi:repressor LexA
MPFNERLKQLRKDRGLSQNELAEVFGYKSFTTIQKWEDGSSYPPAKLLPQLAAYFSVSVESLMNETETLRPVPILGMVRGGPLRLAEQEWLGQEWVSEQELSHGEYFYLEVVGDSMIQARIHPGDLVFVRRQAMVSQGKIAVVLVEDEATLKRVYFEEGKLILRAENLNYPDQIYTNEQILEKNIQIIGEVIHVKISL